MTPIKFMSDTSDLMTQRLRAEVAELRAEVERLRCAATLGPVLDEGNLEYQHRKMLESEADEREQAELDCGGL